MKRTVKMISTVLIAAVMVGLMGNPLVKSENEVQAATYSSNREYAVAELKKMADIQWKPTTKNLAIGGYTYYKNTVYKGMPYTKDYNTTYTDFISGKNGSYGSSGSNVFNYKGSASVGNDCSTVPALAWKFKFTSIGYASISTADYLSCAQNGRNSTYHLATVNGYKITGSDTKLYINAKEEENKNNRTTILNALKKLQKGDCCLYYYTNNGELKKHVIFVVGTYSGGVYITDQIGRKSGDTNSSWRHSKAMSWDDLLNSGYVPIRCTDMG